MLLKGLKQKGSLHFEEVFSAAPTKEEVVTLFLALLELLRLGETHIVQEDVYGDIVLLPGRSELLTKKADLLTQEVRGRIEAILFVAGEPVLVSDLAKALEMPEADVNRVLELLVNEYDFEQRGFCLKRFGKHVQLATRAIYADWVERLLQPVQKQSLSQAAMETLAVVAYPPAGNPGRGGADSRGEM